MRNIERRTGENMTGILALYFQDMETVSAIKPSNNGQLKVSDITSTGTWHEMEFVKETAGWLEEKTLTPNGPAFDQVIEFLIAKDSIDRLRELNQFAGKQLLVIAIDHNDIMHLSGYINQQGEKYGMQVSHKLATQKKWGDAAKNAYQVTLTSQSPVEAAQLIFDVGVIDGPSELIPTIDDSTEGVYTLPPVPGALSYEWAAPSALQIVGAGGQFIFNNGNSIVVKPEGCGPYTLSVTPIFSWGRGDRVTKTININCD